MVITLATKPTMDDIALNISIGAPFYQWSLDLREAFTKPSFKNFYSHGTLEFAFYHFYVQKGSVFIKILAFDQALKKTGVCTLDDSMYFHSMIDLSKMKDASERNTMMRQMIQSRIKTNAPDLVVIEDVALQRSPKALIQLAQLQGAIIGVCDVFNVPYMVLKPTEWRQTLDFKQGRNVKRNELKQQAIDYVSNNFNEIVSSDEADAICIAVAAKMRLENTFIKQED